MTVAYARQRPCKLAIFNLALSESVTDHNMESKMRAFHPDRKISLASSMQLGPL